MSRTSPGRILKATLRLQHVLEQATTLPWDRLLHGHFEAVPHESGNFSTWTAVIASTLARQPT